MDGRSESYLHAACILADRLLERAHGGHEGLYWQSIRIDSEQNGSLQVVENLYSGNAGIALFLVELSGLTGQAKYQDAAMASLRWLTAFCAVQPPQNLGGFTGRTSTFFPLIRFGELSGDRRFLDMALTIGRGCWDPSWRQWPDPLDDLLSGKAGALLAFLHLHAATGEDWILQPIDFLIEALLRRAHPGPKGFYWDHNPHQIKGLCGLSHGASGIGFAFAELGHYFGNGTFSDLADLAFAYEDFHYGKHGNWPDFRKGIYNEAIQQEFLETFAAGDLDFFKRPTHMDMWCHGAVGVGLARLRAYQRTGKDTVKRSLAQALEATLKTELAIAEPRHLLRFVSLCHGRTGNRDFLLEAGRVLGEDRLQSPAFALGDLMVSHLEQGGSFPCGYPNMSQQDTSLFMGDAGLGYFLLRLADPATVSCILAPQLPFANPLPPSKGEHGHLHLTRTAAQRGLLERVYPRSLACLESEEPALGAAFFGDHGDALDLRTPFARFLPKAASAMKPGAACALRACFHLETARYRQALACESFILVHVRHLDHREKLRHLGSLPDPELRRQRLVLNPDSLLVAPAHHAAVANPGKGGFVLLVPTAGNQMERPLSSMSHLILTHFGKPATVAHILPAILAGIEIRNESDRLLAESAVLDQIRLELSSGCLHLA